ncbi:sulfate anion transporter 1-like [Protopterus annectens]|uniref:sulfate anion transporter 1-like n=1 Tax=Protopterus annectens TaxID=7888 RepID=UPI001CFB8632|nr:sulfate anion transporter 1-like [Protopterus annectens]
MKNKMNACVRHCMDLDYFCFYSILGLQKSLQLLPQKEGNNRLQMEKNLSLQIHLEQKAHVKKDAKTVLKDKIKRRCSCSKGRLKKQFVDFLPVLQWLPKYRFKEYIWGDVMSGLIIGIILVPQAIAYSLLAGLKPIYSLYTSFFANIIYFFMGTSRHVSVGIFSLMSLLIGQVVDREVQLAGFDQSEYFNKQNVTDISPANFNITEHSMDQEYEKEHFAVGVAAAVTCLAGVYQVLMAVFHLGFVSVYLAEPMLDGFATGASLTILTVQVKYLLGIKLPRSQGFGTLVITWINIFKNIHNANVCDVITSAICIAVLVGAKELGDRYKQKLKIPLPTELVVVVVATLVSHYANFNEVYGSSVAGEIPTGFIPPKVPNFAMMYRVALDAVPLAIIGFAFTVSLSEMFAKKHGYTVRANQEMFAVGFCNIIPAFFHSFATSAALAKTLVKDSTGCQTQVSGVISAVVVLLVLLFFAPLFYSLQKCILACIIIVSLRGALRKFHELPQRWYVNKTDALIWIVTMLSSALISTEMGLLVGVVFSVICVIGRTQHPHIAVLGQIPNHTFYEDVSEYENLCLMQDIKIFRLQAPLYYANKDFFQKFIYKMSGVNPILEITKKQKAEREFKKQAKLEHRVKAVCNNAQTVCSNERNETVMHLVPNHWGFHTLIFDCSSIPFVDTAGISVLKGILRDYKEIGISVLLAGCSPSVIDSLQRAGYFGKNDENRNTSLFCTVHSAVLYAEDSQSREADSQV